jgi:hypothetical protein
VIAIIASIGARPIDNAVKNIIKNNRITEEDQEVINKTHFKILRNIFICQAIAILGSLSIFVILQLFGGYTEGYKYQAFSDDAVITILLSVGTLMIGAIAQTIKIKYFYVYDKKKI